MRTTTLIVELLIIGLLALVWITLFVGLIFGQSWFGMIETVYQKYNWAVTVGIIALAYVVGVITEEICESLINLLVKLICNKYSEENIYKKLIDKDIPKHWNIQGKIFAKSEKTVELLEYIRGRLRIARSSIFNLFLITLSSFLYLMIRVEPNTHWRSNAMISVAAIGGIAVIISVIVYFRLLRSHWGRAISIYKHL